MVRVLDAIGRVVGDTAGGRATSLPYGNIVDLEESGTSHAQLITLSSLPVSPLTIEVTGTGSGTFDLGIAAQIGGPAMTQLRYGQVSISPSAVVRLT